MKIGNLVRFVHEKNGGPVRRVVSVMSDGMIEVHDMGGYFAPHLFVEADDVAEIPPPMANPRLLDADKVVAVVERRMAFAADAVECELHDELWQLLDAIRSLPSADTGDVERLRHTLTVIAEVSEENWRDWVDGGYEAAQPIAFADETARRARAALNKQET